MSKEFLLVMTGLGCLLFTACSERDYGANPYDPDTPVTVSEMPKINSFEPTEGKTGDIIEITGANFSTATAVTFGGKAAGSFEVISDELIEATVGPYGGTGAVGVTNHKGTRSLDGFLYVEEVISDNPNLALNKPATAHESFNDPSLAVDGDMGSRWSAEAGDGHWFQVDLMKVYSINTIVIRWEGAYASEYDLQVSTDDVNFTTIYSTIDAVGGVDSIAFANTDARYVKILLNKAGTPWNMSFYEFEVYNTPPPPNLALNKPATAHESFNDPSLAVDGDPGTRWSATEGDGHWFQVDLVKEYTISKVCISWEGAYASEYEIQVSTDNLNFTSVFSTTTGEGGDVEHLFAPITARYVKILLHKAGTPWNMSFWEFEVYE
ncbi:MAG: discoidin domain-containing protein [Tannerellaceae bacterium]|nr:discoidin domain-containing protein [Tannerellaceae bacterium]